MTAQTDQERALTGPHQTTPSDAQPALAAEESLPVVSTDPQLHGCTLPRHLGIIVDGNRRWAREAGVPTIQGHRVGAAKVLEALGWLDELELPLVTIWLLSRDNLRRSAEELTPLIQIITDLVHGVVEDGYAVRITGDPDVLPAEACREITETVASADSSQRAPRRHLAVNLAIGYGGREEITAAARAAVREALSASDQHDEQPAEQRVQQRVDQAIDALTVDNISRHLYTSGQPDPDLIIRTSGEQRLSGFLLWQSVHSEFWFCETNWPAFQREDLIHALQDYCGRERRFGA